MSAHCSLLYGRCLWLSHSRMRWKKHWWNANCTLYWTSKTRGFILFFDQRWKHEKNELTYACSGDCQKSAELFVYLGCGRTIVCQKVICHLCWYTTANQPRALGRRCDACLMSDRRLYYGRATTIDHSAIPARQLINNQAVISGAVPTHFIAHVKIKLVKTWLDIFSELFTNANGFTRECCHTLNGVLLRDDEFLHMRNNGPGRSDNHNLDEYWIEVYSIYFSRFNFDLIAHFWIHAYLLLLKNVNDERKVLHRFSD